MAKVAALPAYSGTVALSGVSYESRIIHTLQVADAFCESSGIAYAVFGGSGVAAYLGHLPRKIHDVDLLLSESDVPRFKRFLRALGYVQRKTPKARRAHFLKYILENHIYQQVVSIFPGKFTLLDLADPKLRPLGAFDFHQAILSSKRHEIQSLQTTVELRVSVRALPIEDLLISKLWPVVEPTTIHDSFYLLSAVIAPGRVDFDWEYFSSRIQSTQGMKEICFRTFSELVDLYPKTVWFRGLEQKASFDTVVSKVMVALQNATDTQAQDEARILRLPARRGKPPSRSG